MGRRKDPCWDHAENLSSGSDVSFQCNYCSVKYKGGASRLKAHLSGKKNGGIGPCPDVPDDVVEKLSGRKRASTDTEKENVSCSLPSSSDRNTRPRVLEKKKDKRWVDDKLVGFLRVFDLPCELVESHIFSDFVKAVAQYGSDYELPDLKTLNQLGHVYDSRVESYANKVESSLVEIGCTLIVDDDGELYRCSPCGALHQCATIEESNNGTEKKDDEILRIINTCVESIVLTKVLQIFLDGYDVLGFNLKNSLIDRYRWMNIGNSPTAGIGRLCINIFELDGLEGTLRLAYALTTEIDNYWTYARIDTAKYYAGPEPVLYFSNETIVEFWMLKSLLKFRDEGQRIVICDTIQFTGYEKSYVNHLIHCEEFWVRAKVWVSVLQPLFEALFLTGNKMYPASGYLYQIMEKVRVAIGKCCCMGQDDIKRLVNLFDEFREKNMHPMYAAAAFLNPAYMCSERFEENEELKRGIDFIRSHWVEIDERGTFMDEFNRYRLKELDIFTTTAKSALKSYHPATWWKYFGDCVPSLQKYAIRILSQPCNSFNCHELYLKRRFAQNYRHDVDALMMEKFGKLETQTLRAIDINNIGIPEWLNEYQTRERPLDQFQIRYLDCRLEDLKDTLKGLVPRGCLSCGHLPRNG